MESMKMMLSYILLIIVVLVGVAFVTLMEQKILAGSQIRVGPSVVGYWGIFQPFSDAIKLFSKESMSLWVSNSVIYYLSPMISLGLILILWPLIPFLEGGLGFEFGIMYFIVISGLGVYPILSLGWSSNCKYSVLGSYRAVAQMVSYEVSLAMVLLSLIWLASSFNLVVVIESQSFIYNLVMSVPLALIWLISSLAETNRTPYDFSEGESELVSGFNTEYSSGGFVLIFMAEYASILFMSLFFCILFMGSEIWFSLSFKLVLLSSWFVWVRATLPRYRYDKLMNLAWKSFLPVSLGSLIFLLGFSFLLVLN
nr:NADH dehydrogenase subunit 1 [Onisimus nanseni]